MTNNRNPAHEQRMLHRAKFRPKDAPNPNAEDDKMPGIRSSSISCGVHQVYGISSFFNNGSGGDVCTAKKKKGAIDFLSTIKEGRVWLEDSQFWHSNGRCGMYIFSDWDANGGGKALAKYITEEKLGGITASEQVRNPNSSHQIQTWIWYPDYKAVEAKLQTLLNEKKETVDEPQPERAEKTKQTETIAVAGRTLNVIVTDSPQSKPVESPSIEGVLRKLSKARVNRPENPTPRSPAKTVSANRR